MEKLKIGDQLYLREYTRWSQEYSFKESEVVRLTNKRAILSNGKQIINEIDLDRDGQISYLEYGDKYNRWKIQTKESIQEINEWKEQINRSIWWNKFYPKITKEQLKLIYELFNKKDAT